MIQSKLLTKVYKKMTKRKDEMIYNHVLCKRVTEKEAKDNLPIVVDL